MSIEIKKALKQIKKQVNKSCKTCMIPGCNLPSINSHILQKNGVLNSISRNGHVYELRETDIFKVKDSQHGYIANLVGINKAFSFPLFCNAHDTNEFIEIECKNPNFYNYRSFILLSYRALCTEMRRKLDAKKEKELILLDKTIKNNMSFDMEECLHVYLSGLKQGIKHLEFLKKKLEIDKYNTHLENFYFRTYEYFQIPICASAVFTPGEAPQIATFAIGDLPSIFIHIVPFENKSLILVGYLKTHSSIVIDNYVASWCGLNKEQLYKKVNDLIVARIETWCCSPDAFEKIPEETLDRYNNYTYKNAFNHSMTQKVEFNLFNNF